MSRRHQSLLKFARKNSFSSARESHGVCFHAALQLGAHAAELGLTDEVRFVHWRVLGDPHFREHWALSFRAGHVLDVTAVQVDGNCNPLRKKDTYPPHFGGPRDYPLSLILRHVPAGGQGHGNRVPAGLIWRVHRSMIAYDLRRDSTQGVAFPLVLAVGRLAETSVVLSLHALSEWARSRLATLRSRLSSPASAPVEPPPHVLLPPQDIPWRATIWRAVLNATRRLAKAICAIFFLGVPV